MGQFDTMAKKYLADNARFADAFNFKIYGGRQVLKAENLREMDTTEIVLPYGNDAKAPLQKFRDVMKIYSARHDDKVVYIVLGLEAQANLHYAMPVRNMLYDAMNYARQVGNAAKSYRKTSEGLRGDEYLSGFAKDDNIMPVVTLVLSFTDEPWDAPTSLHEMFTGIDEEVLALVPDYKINLLSPSDIDDEEFANFVTELGSVLQFVKHQNDEDMDWLSGNEERFEQVDFESAEMIKFLTGVEIGEKKGESVNMCRAWANSLEKARKEAREEAWQEAYNECEQKMGDAVSVATLTMIRNAMESFHLTAKEAMDGLKISAAEQARYAAQL